MEKKEKEVEEEKEQVKKEKKNIGLKIKFLIVILILIIGVGGFIYFKNQKPKVTVDYLVNVLSKSSELTTAKLKLTGLMKYEDTGMPVLNKADFTMKYDAVVRAGINIEDVKVDVNNMNKTVYVKIPKAKILDVKVDPSSIEYFDTKLALFNTDEKEDASSAATKAEQEMKNKAPETGLLELADQQSATLIKGILSEAISNGYKINVEIN